LDPHGLSDFYSSAEIIEETIGRRELGMPELLVPFASDGGGNKFCFDAGRLNNGSAEGNAIRFYDHGFGAVDQIAASFDAWIEAFCLVQPVARS
jgi:hypothetical protein